MKRVLHATMVMTLMVLAVAGPLRADDVPRPDLTGVPAPIATAISRAAAAVDAAASNGDAWGDYGVVLHAHSLKADADIAYSRAQGLQPTEFRWPYFRGVMLLKVDAEKALASLDEALRLDPRYAAGHVRRGLALEDLGRNDDARAAYLKAFELEPGNTSIQMHLGQVELTLGNLDEAIRLLEEALRDRPNEQTILSSLAKAFMRKGDRETARAYADRARTGAAGRIVDDVRFAEVALASLAEQAFVDRAQIHRQARRPRKSRAELERGLGAYPRSGPIHAAMARDHYARNDFAASVTSGERALELGHHDDALGVTLGAAYLRLGKLNEANEAIDRVLARSPRQALAHQLAGSIAVRRGNDELAVEHFTSSLDARDDVQVRCLRAEARTRLGSPTETIAEMSALLATAPNTTAAWLALGAAQQATDDHASAVTSFDKAASTLPGGTKTPAALRADRQAALSLGRDGQHAEAATRLRTLRTEWPNNLNLRNDLAWLLATCPTRSVRDGRHALSLIQPLVRQTKRKQPAVLDTLAAALAETGRYDDAVSTIDEALALLPPGPSERRTGFEARRTRYAAKRAWREE